MTTYRACYYATPGGQAETVLTLPEHAALSDDALLAEALAEADRAGLIGDDDPEDLLTHQQLVDGLTIGEWTDV